MPQLLGTHLNWVEPSVSLLKWRRSVRGGLRERRHKVGACQNVGVAAGRPDGCLTANKACASRGLYLKDFDGSQRPLNSQGSCVQNSHRIIQLVLS